MRGGRAVPADIYANSGYYMHYFKCRDHTLQIFAAYRTAMHRSSLTHAADKRPQAIRELRLLCALPFVPRRAVPAGKYANSVYCMRHYCAAIILYRYLPHTLPKATLSLTHTIPPPDSFLFFYMIRAGSFCCTSLYRRARNRKAMRNIPRRQI